MFLRTVIVLSNLHSTMVVMTSRALEIIAEADDLLASPELIETKLTADGRQRFRIKGIAMAWAASLVEARRIAQILTRAGYGGTTQRG